MASIKLMKKSAHPMMAHKVGAAAPSAFAVQDNEDGTDTVTGVDVQGASVDISAVAGMVPAPVSDNLTILSVDAPNGMTYGYHALLPGTANVTLGATWTDGSVGPFTIVQPYTVSGSAATGLVVTHGVPTIRVVTPPTP
jgi:hypothetical protein